MTIVPQAATATATTTAVDDHGACGGVDAPSNDNFGEGASEGDSEPSLLEVRAHIIGLIAAKSRDDDRYATLLSQCQTRAAHDLIDALFRQIAEWQLKSGERVRGYRAKRGTRRGHPATRIAPRRLPALPASIGSVASHLPITRARRARALISRRSRTASALRPPCFQAFLFPFGGPGDLPPCSLHLPFGIAGE
jgi:hypothetical protein